MYNYNITENNIPSFYNEVEGYNNAFYLKNGWTFFYNNDVPNLQIGEKYYMKSGVNCIAFKIEGIIFMPNYVVFQALFATNEKKYIPSYSLSLTEIFTSTEDYIAYCRTTDKSYLYSDTIDVSSYLIEYINLGLLTVFRPHSYHPIISVPLYGIDEYNKVNKFVCLYKYLWIDKEGLHYSVFEHKNGSFDKLYTTYEECEKTLHIIDFEGALNEMSNLIDELEVEVNKITK